MKIIVFRHFGDVQEVEQMARQNGCDFVRSRLYSLQTDLLEDVRDGTPVILCGVGVRYDDVCEWIADHHLSVYRVDTLFQLSELLRLFADGKDTSQYLANLNES